MDLFGDSFWIFFFMTIVIGGGAAYLAGRGLAVKWRPLWMPLAYMIPLAMTLRFLYYALYEGDLLSIPDFLADLMVLIAAALLGYRLMRTSQMVNQYPWLYERTSPLTWRNRAIN